MKKYLSLTLIFVMLISMLAGCKSNTKTPAETLPTQSTTEATESVGTEPNATEPAEETTPADDYVRQEYKYHSKYFNSKMLIPQLSQTAILPQELEALKLLLIEFDKGIIDTYVLNGTLYALTPTKLCRANDTMTIEIFDINRDDNVTIVYADLQLLVLQNEKGEYSFWRFDINNQKYEKFQWEDFKPETNEHIVCDTNLATNFLHVVKDVNKEGITTQAFIVEYDYMQEKIVTSSSTQTYKFDIPFEQEIKKYVFTNKNSKLSCAILLENNELHYVESLYGLEVENKLQVKDVFLTNVADIQDWDGYLIVEKMNDEKNLYQISFYEDWTTKEYNFTETVLPFQDKFITSDIVKIYHAGFHVTANIYFELNNGKVYRLRSMETMEEMSVLEQFAGKNQIDRYYPFGYDEFIMDDGHLYTLLDPNIEYDYLIIE